MRLELLLIEKGEVEKWCRDQIQRNWMDDRWMERHRLSQTVNKFFCRRRRIGSLDTQISSSLESLDVHRFTVRE